MTLTIAQVEAIARYCSEEVRRQQRGPTEVGGMVAAWLDALERARRAGVTGRQSRLRDVPPAWWTTAVVHWAHLIEPETNAGDWRGVSVRVGDYLAPAPQELDRLMARWGQTVAGMTPDEAYYEFERVHPFRDGNGRVGKIVYNLKRGTLLRPEWPPDFWGVGNP